MFLKRLAEECFYAFLGGVAVALQASGDLGTAALTGAAVAGGRAALGVVIRHLGEQDRPSVK
jgi:hypothetical protein